MAYFVRYLAAPTGWESLPLEMPEAERARLIALYPYQPREVTAHVAGLGQVTARHAMDWRAMIIAQGVGEHHVPDRFTATVRPELGLLTIELELVCQTDNTSPSIVVGVESVRFSRDPRHDGLTTSSLRVPLKKYADEATNLISYIEQRDWTGLAWLVPRFVNEPIAYVMPLSWDPALEPLNRPALALRPSDEVQPGLYGLSARSFLRAYREQPNIARRIRRGRTPTISDTQLPALAQTFNNAQRAPVVAVEHAFPHHPRRTIDRAIRRARDMGSTPPAGSARKLLKQRTLVGHPGLSRV